MYIKDNFQALCNPVAASFDCTFVYLRSAYRESITLRHFRRGIENEAYSAAALT
jgi:hypothetical protein